MNFRLTHPQISFLNHILLLQAVPTLGFKQLQIPMQKKLLLPDACSIPWELPRVKCNCTVSSQGSLQAVSYQALRLGAAHALEELQRGVISHLEVVITCIQPIMGARQ